MADIYNAGAGGPMDRALRRMRGEDVPEPPRSPPVAGDATRDDTALAFAINEAWPRNADGMPLPLTKTRQVLELLAALRPAPETAAPVAWQQVASALWKHRYPRSFDCSFTEADEDHPSRKRIVAEAKAVVSALYAAPPAPASAPLRDAAFALYEAGRWTCGLPAEREAQMWVALRDALGLPEGYATSRGVHSSAPASGEQRADVTDADIVWLQRVASRRGAQKNPRFSRILAALRARPEGRRRERPTWDIWLT